jgi:hypothetical protein
MPNFKKTPFPTVIRQILAQKTGGFEDMPEPGGSQGDIV